ncbi:hypothetical protein AMTRI_Chr04g185470 [Amborella trichopoda]
MKLEPGLSAFVTGGASGIGKALSLTLAKKGVHVTIVDFSEVNGKEVSVLVERELKKFHPMLQAPSSLFIRCDVSNSGDLAAAFDKHMESFGQLDICINCAGISTPISFYQDKSDGTSSWRRAVNVNLIAVIDGTHLAVSGVVMFTRSLIPYKRQGIRVNVLCPEFVLTELAQKMDPKFIQLTGGFMTMNMVVEGAFELIEDETKAGACLWITKRRGMEYWPTHMEERKYRVNSWKSKRTSSYIFPSIEVPRSFEKIVVHTLSHNFRKATAVVRTSLKFPINDQHVLIKILYAGVNASDVNFSSGRYFSGDQKGIASRLPFDAGFEVAVGVIAAVGESVKGLKIGSPVATMSFGSYAEFSLVSAKHVIPVTRPDPEVVAMLTSGLTASIALEEAAQLGSGKVVLVTAAAGGTGQFAVQLAKLARNKVVATCGGAEKAGLLKDLGVDRVIDYRVEDIKSVLKKEYPKGVDIIYESVGGEMFNMCLNALAVYGRMVVIGMISQYQGAEGWKPLDYTGLCEKILAKSQTIAGFFLVQYAHLWQEHLDRLYDLFSAGKLKVVVDPKQFVGLNSVADAVEYLHSGKSLGKVVVCIDPRFSRSNAKL